MYEKSYCSFMKNLNFVLTTLLHVSCNISVTTLFFSLEKIHVISLLRGKNRYITVYVIKAIVTTRNALILS